MTPSPDFVTSHSWQPLPPVTFRSRHCPTDDRLSRVRGQYVMREFAILAFGVLVLVVLRQYARQELLWFTVLGLLAAFGIAWWVADYRMNSQWAALSLQDDTLTLHSVAQWLGHPDAAEAFPLAYLQPHPHPKGLQITFHDQLVVLNKADWPDWDPMLLRLRQALPRT